MTRTRNDRRKDVRMKIGALEEATGVSRDTIHFYVRSGLLHRPVKTGATVAYYDSTHLERLRCIRALRARGLPLPVVRRLLDEGGEHLSPADLDLIALLLTCVEQAESPRTSPLPEPVAELADQLGLRALAESDGHLGTALAAVVELPDAIRSLAIAMATTMVSMAREAIAREQAPLVAWLGALENPATVVTDLRRTQSALRALSIALRDALVRDAMTTTAQTVLATRRARQRSRRTNGRNR